ncbi:MAG: hypothetical protein H0T76_16645 [Nannocystis sp.]|nr:hypothetical protein [Nannocystis sp.]MBA3548112.1 hypothetical protein [Nannocystis sp.]
MPITTRSIVLLAPTVFMAACAADWPVLEGCDDGCTTPMSISTTGDAPPTTTEIHTVTGDTTENGPQATGGADNTGGTDTLSTGESGAASETGNHETILPEVVAIELPAEVNAAGPVPITVLTNAASVRVKLDGVDVGELVAAGDEKFVGELAVKGAINNGTRHVEVIATLGEYEDSKGASFEVKVPEAGKAAWAMPGPPGSRTNRIALTPEGDVIEAGLRIGAGVPRPSVHKRSGFDGSDLWPKKVLLSELEGHVADVALAPDGGIWVAMNVKEASQKWRPHILLLAPDGSLTGVDRPGELGQTLRGIAADAKGGCFAVGYAVVDGGDLDVVFQGVSATHQGTIADTWDHQPADALPNSFADAAMDVVIDGDIAWVAGLSVGLHDGENGIDPFTRGLIVPIAIRTGDVVGPVIIAPAAGSWKHSMFLGLGLDSDGIVVTGAGCQVACGGLQRIETSRYTLAGVRTWHQPEMSAEGAYGSDVVVDSQGRAIVVGASKEGGVLRGRALAHTIGKIEQEPLWAHWFPVSKESSEALGAARDPFDRVFIGGYVTAGGSPQTRLVQISP